MSTTGASAANSRAADDSNAATSASAADSRAAENSNADMTALTTAINRLVEINKEMLETYKEIAKTNETIAKTNETIAEGAISDKIAEEKFIGTYFAPSEKFWKTKMVPLSHVEGRRAVESIKHKIIESQNSFLAHCEFPPKCDQYLEIAGAKLPGHFKRAKDTYKSSNYGKLQNIFGTAAHFNRGSTERGHNSFAHLVPSAGTCSSYWTDYAPILTGAEGTKEENFVAIHGFSLPSEMYFPAAFMGAKNTPQNLLALPPNHCHRYDGEHSGNLIIAPIIDTDGDGQIVRFDLLVIARDAATYKWIYQGEEDNIVKSLYNADRGVTLATKEDKIKATRHLQKLMIASAHLGTTVTLPRLENESTKNWYHQMCGRFEAGSVRACQDNGRQILRVLRKIRTDGVVPVPELKEGYEDLRVLKVELWKYMELCGLKEDYYPSWSLVGGKACSNYGALVGYNFMPSCPGADDDIREVSLDDSEAESDDENESEDDSERAV